MVGDGGGGGEGEVLHRGALALPTSRRRGQPPSSSRHRHHPPGPCRAPRTPLAGPWSSATTVAGTRRCSPSASVRNSTFSMVVGDTFNSSSGSRGPRPGAIVGAGSWNVAAKKLAALSMPSTSAGPCVRFRNLVAPGPGVMDARAALQPSSFTSYPFRTAPRANQWPTTYLDSPSSGGFPGAAHGSVGAN